MTQKDHILQELKELNSSLVNLSQQNVYSVPVGYFDGLAAQVMKRIKALEAINAKEELNHLSPLLNSISILNSSTSPEFNKDSIVLSVNLVLPFSSVSCTAIANNAHIFIQNLWLSYQFYHCRHG